MRLMKFVSLEPMQSRGGNPLANQQILSDDNGSMFVSYGTKICYKTEKRFNIQGVRRPQYVFDENYWDYSRTTSKYRNEFLGFGVAECRQGIKEGWIKLDNLNKR